MQHNLRLFPSLNASAAGEALLQHSSRRQAPCDSRHGTGKVPPAISGAPGLEDHLERGALCRTPKDRDFDLVDPGGRRLEHAAGV